MAQDEFSLIKKYFKQKTPIREDVTLGIGDDCALTKIPQDHELVVTVDTLVADVHFPRASFTPGDIASLALSMNLSDMAAMGAEPRWFTLALTLPEASPSFLEEFSESLFVIAEKFNLQLIGGDTTRGPLTISIQLLGVVPQGKAILRSGAKIGDLIYVTGELGKAVLPDLLPQTLNGAEKNSLFQALAKPTPRVKESLALREMAHAAIDISDGLLADLGHILNASDVGATITLEKIPAATLLKNHLPLEEAIELAATNGDDYELCLCIPPENEKHFLKIMQSFHCPVTLIGEITQEKSLTVVDASGKPYPIKKSGYLHF